MSTASRTESQWKARFNVRPDGVIVSRVLDLPDITLVTEPDGSNSRIKSIEIITPNARAPTSNS